jgi:four helix bundle protein
MSRADHKNLKAWQLARELVSDIYRFTAAFPDSEKFGLVSQMRRAAVSIPSNIAEGAAKGSANELRRFAQIARGSLAELETQLILSSDLGLCNETQRLQEKIRQLLRVISGLIRSQNR